MLTFYGLDYTYYDHPNKYSLILYVSGCNLKCYGCHNRKLAGWDYNKQEQFCKFNTKKEYQSLSYDEIKLAITPMLDMIILCGGELLLNSVEDIKRTIDWIKKDNPELLIRIDTNGTFPDKILELKQRGKVDGFAIDIKGPYRNKGYFNDIKKVLGINNEGMFKNIIKSINIVKDMSYSIFRTVKYPIIKDEQYFIEIKKFIKNNLLENKYMLNKYIEV